MGGDGSQRKVPKAVRHRRILDIAEDQPDASLDEIAAEVPSATVDLVENILEEYGDPGLDESDSEEAEDEAADDDEAPTLSLDEKQRETLQAIHNNPEMTQRELGEVLGVSKATVCNRVNSIDGFEWNSRQEFASIVLSTQDYTEEGAKQTMSSNGSELTEKAEELSEKVESLEDRIEAESVGAKGDGAMQSPELTHKVMHACIESDNISEDEELQILKELMQ